MVRKLGKSRNCDAENGVFNGLRQGLRNSLFCGICFRRDLLNQCVASAYSLRDTNIPFFGLYGACSTMAESIALAAIMVDGAFANTTAAVTSSHFCSAERQFRFPLEYGGQRTPTAQWTATAAGAVIITSQGNGPFITHVTTGRIKDAGITDMNNMGAAMAVAAYDTLTAHFNDTKLSPSDYDLIVTGDLGAIGHSIVMDFLKDGVDLAPNYDDCGLMLYDRKGRMFMPEAPAAVVRLPSYAATC